MTHKENQLRKSMFAKSNLDKTFTKNKNPENPLRFIYSRKFRNPWSLFRQQSSADYLLLPLWRPTSVRQRERGFYNILYYWIILVHPRKWWPLIGLRTSVTILMKGSSGKRPAYETLNATKGISSRSRGICCYLQTYTARTSSSVLPNGVRAHMHTQRYDCGHPENCSE